MADSAQWGLCSENPAYRRPLYLFTCGDSDIDHRSKLDGLAPLITYPPTGNTTTLHSRVNCKDQNVCLGQSAYLPVNLKASNTRWGSKSNRQTDSRSFKDFWTINYSFSWCFYHSILGLSVQPHPVCQSLLGVRAANDFWHFYRLERHHPVLLATTEDILKGCFCWPPGDRTG